MKSIPCLLAVVLSVGLTASALAATPDQIEVNGDIRVREELLSNEGRSADTPNQTRLSVRLGVKGRLSPKVDGVIRFASNVGPTTSNFDMGRSSTNTNGEGFRNTPIYLERAYIHWTGVEYLHAYVGRVKNTLYFAGGNDLVYDWDVNFDGGTINFETPHGSFSEFLNLGYYWVTKTSDTSSGTAPRDIHLIVPQIGIRGGSDEVKWSVGLGLHYYDHMKGAGAVTSATSKLNTYSGGRYANDFRTSELGADLTTSIFDKALTFYFTNAMNGAADTERHAFIVGFKLGGLKKVGQAQLMYDYRRVEADSVLSDVAEGSIALGAGSNHRTHRFKIGYVIDDGLTVATGLSFAKVGIAEGQTPLSKNRYQLDLSYSF